MKYLLGLDTSDSLSASCSSWKISFEAEPASSSSLEWLIIENVCVKFLMVMIIII